MTVADRMCELVWSFPVLRRTRREDMTKNDGKTWDSVAFASHWAAGSGGEKDAALFVLSVWNPDTDWSECGLSRGGERGGYFDLHRALGNWDRDCAAAMLKWIELPWWP